MVMPEEILIEKEEGTGEIIQRVRFIPLRFAGTIYVSALGWPF